MQMMKDSGIAWIGEIPGTWDVIKFKYVFSIVGGNGFPDSLQGNTQGDYPFCKVSDINGDNDYVKSAANWVTQKTVDSYKFNVIPPYSILMAKIGAALAKNHRKINTLECCIDNNTQALILKRNDSIRYLFYLSKCLDMSWFDNNSTVPSINNTKLLNSYIPNIPHDKQEIIAGCLDIECTRIDAVIEQTRTSIEEYKKLKQAVITQAVTKGIRPNRPMKDSGVDWIGTVPCDWTIQKLKNIIIAIESGVSVNAAQYPAQEGEIGVLKTSCVSKFTFLPEENKAVNQEEYDRVACPVKANTIIMSRMNTPDLVGACGYVGEDYPKLYLPDRLWQVHFSAQANVKYIWYYLNCRNVRNYYASLAVGTSSSMQNISQDQFYNTFVPIPTAEEQKEIVAYLDEKIPEIDALIDKKEKLISELESYKKSMIYEYVTGKKECN